MLSSSAGCLEVACLGGSLCLPRQRESEAIAQKYGVALRNIAVFWASLLTSPLEAPRAAAKSVRRGQRSPGPPEAEVDWDRRVAPSERRKSLILGLLRAVYGLEQV